MYIKQLISTTNISTEVAQIFAKYQPEIDIATPKTVYYPKLKQFSGTDIGEMVDGADFVYIYSADECNQWLFSHFGVFVQIEVSPQRTFRACIKDNGTSIWFKWTSDLFIAYDMAFKKVFKLIDGRKDFCKGSLSTDSSILSE